MPTPYVPPGLPLPYYARTDLAFIDSNYLGAPGAGLIWVSHPGAGLVERTLFGRYTFTTSAVVANRIPTITYEDSTGAILWSVASPGSTPAGSVGVVTVITGIGSSYVSGNTHVLYVPDTIREPTSSWFWGLTNIDAGDNITQLNFSFQAIPTGPAEDSSAVAVSPVILT